MLQEYFVLPNKRWSGDHRSGAAVQQDQWAIFLKTRRRNCNCVLHLLRNRHHAFLDVQESPRRSASHENLQRVDDVSHEGELPQITNSTRILYEYRVFWNFSQCKNQVNDEDVGKLASRAIPTPEEINPGFRDFIFMPRTLPDGDTARAVLAMFADLNMLNRARMRPEILIR